MTEQPTVLYGVENGAARITLNRPHRRNALSADLVNRLAEALTRANEDEGVRYVALTGAGAGFCAGADLKNPPGRSSSGGEQNTPFSEVLRLMWEGPKPVVVAVNGAAFGGGLGLVAAGDIVITANEASFSFSEVRIGVIPAIISVLSLRKLGRHHGMRLFLSGERFSGAEAVAYGLAHRSVPREELDAALVEELEMLNLGGPHALAECKRLVREVPGLSVEEGFEKTTEWSAAMFRGDEAAEGMAAFREKRRPAWAEVEARSEQDGE